MKLRLSRLGQELGVFTLEEVRRRRQSGEFDGTEWVLVEGASEWKAIDSILETFASLRTTPPPLPPSVTRKGTNRPVVWAIGILAVLFLVGFTVLGFLAYRFAERVRSAMNDATSSQSVTLASKPLKVDTNTPTETDIQKRRRAFRVRQYLDGYKHDGQAGQPWNNDAILLIESWIAQNYGGDERTNLPSARELSDKLVTAGCTDPVVLTIAAVTGNDQSETTRRLKQAVDAFERSSYKAYPRMYATVMLASKLSAKTRREAALDDAAVVLFEQGFTDGSFLPEDQAELADIFDFGWGNGFFGRKQELVIDAVKQAGKPFEWLALILEGESQIHAAWRARGSGYADSVKPEGWKGFHDHLVEARKTLTKAWKLRPDLPLAPSLMITVAMGESEPEDMRLWFERATSAQFDFPKAWMNFKWGLRPRWFGSEEAMLSLGVAAINTGRFDTDVPRKLFDVITDMESDLDLPVGHHIYGRADVWPHLQKMYEGYIAAPSELSQRAGWRSAYAVVAYLAGHYDVARTQLEAIDWSPWFTSTKHWGVDLSVMPLEVAARTGSLGQQIAEAESARENGEIPRALQLYSRLSASTNTDERTGEFVRIQTALLEFEQRLQTGDWVDFLPTDEKDENWRLVYGKALRIAPNLLEVQSGHEGHLLYSRANLGPDFEVRGDFDGVSSSGNDYQAGLVMGIPDFDSRFQSSHWFAFRMKRNTSEDDLVSFSKGWTSNQVSKKAKLNDGHNSFQFRFQNRKATASVNGVEVFREVALNNAAFSSDEFLVGVVAFNDSSEGVIRYRNLQVRRISTHSAAKSE